MPAKKGLDIAFTWGGAAILGVREKNIQLNGESIDITSDENDGWRTLLDVSAQDEVTISITGVSKDRRLMDDYFAGTRTKPASMTYPDGTVIEGEFYLNSFSNKGSYNDAITFEAELRSTGAVDYTPGS